MRNVRNIDFSNVEIAWSQPDARPAFSINNVNGIEFFPHQDAEDGRQGNVFALNKVADFRVSASRNVPDTQLESIDQKEALAGKNGNEGATVKSMLDANESVVLSRRECLGKLALPTAAAMLGAGLLERESAAAVPAKAAASSYDLGTRVYNIRSFGAKGDGATLDTAALQAAIDACTRDGGGTVLVPSGTFVIGTTELKSNVTLHIAASGKLLGSADGKQYHAVDAIPLRGDTTLNEGNWALLFAVSAKRVTIEGPGTIDGQGAQFHSAVRGTPPPSGIGGNKRPYHVLIYQCEDLAIRNVSLLDCAYHSVRIIESTRVHLDGIYIHNRVNGNNDGFHLISAQHVTISNCIVKSQDDACAMFGSCQFITITNSSFSTRWSVFRFGGGHVQNIAISNCLLYEVDGCPMKFQGDPGSIFENISFSNLVLQDVTGPISISVGGHLPPPNDKTPVIARNISFTNIHGTVTTNPAQLSEASVTSGYNPGETHSCIVLNSVNDSILERGASHSTTSTLRLVAEERRKMPRDAMCR